MQNAGFLMMRFKLLYYLNTRYFTAVKMTFDTFLIFAQNIVCGYMFEPLQ